MQHGMSSITVQMRLVRGDFTCLFPFRTSGYANRLSLGYGLSLFAEKIIKKYETFEDYDFEAAVLVFLQTLSEAAEKHETLKTRVEQALRLLILWHQRHEVKNQVVCGQNVYLSSLRNGIELNLSYIRQLSYAQYQQLHKLYSSEGAAQNLIICKTLLSELNFPVRAAAEKHPVLRPVIKPHSLAKSFRAILESVAHTSRAPGGREFFPNPVINQLIYRLTGKKTGETINFENKLPDMTRVGYPAPYERRQASLSRANLFEAVNILNIPADHWHHAGQGEFAATPGARERLDTGRHSVLHSVLPRLSALLFSREYRREIFRPGELDRTSLTLKQYISTQQHFVWSEIEKLVNQYKTVEKLAQQHTTAVFRQFNHITVPAGRRPITDSQAATIFKITKAVINREMAPGQTSQNLMWSLAQNIKHLWFSSGRVYQYRTPQAAASLTGSMPAAKAKIIHVFKESPAWADGLQDTGSGSLIPRPGSFTSAGRHEAPAFAGDQRRQMRPARRQPQAVLPRANLFEAVNILNIPAGHWHHAGQGEFAATPGARERLDTGRHSVLPRLSALLFSREYRREIFHLSPARGRLAREALSFPGWRQFTESEKLDGTSLTLKQYTSSQQHFVWREIEKLVNQYETVERLARQHTTAVSRQLNRIDVPAGRRPETDSQAATVPADRRPITDSRAATVNRDRDETIFQMVKAVMNREMAPGQTGQNLMWGLAQNIKHQWFSSGRVYQYRTPEAAASLTGSKPAAKAQIIHVFKESPAWAAGLKGTGSRGLIPWPGSFTSAGRLEAPVFAGEQRRQMRQARRRPQALLTRANLMEAVNVPAGYLPYAAQGEFAAVPGVKERLDTGRHSVLPRLSALLFAPSFPDRRQFTKSERTRIIEPGTREEKVLVFAAGNNFEFSRPIPDSQAATVFKITKAVMNREMAPGQTSQNLMWSLAQNIKHLWFSSGRERQYRTPQAAASRTGSVPAAKAKIIHVFKESPAWAAGPKDTGSGSLIPRPDSFTSAGKHEAPAFAGAKRHHVYPLRQQPPPVAARPAEAAAHAALFPPGPQMVTREEHAAKAGRLRPTAGKPASATVDRILNMSSSNVILINRYQMRRQTADTVTLPDVRDQVDLKNNAPVMVHASDKAQGAERQKATRSMPSQRELINRFGNLVADPNVPPSELIDAQAGSLSSDAGLGVPGKAQHVSELIKKITLGERIIREEQRKVSEITQKVEAQEDVINKLNQAYQQLQEDLAARISEKRITAVIMKELRARLALDKMRYGLQ